MKKLFLILNVIFAAGVFAGNYFYLTEGGLLIKSFCSGGFALLGIINLVYTVLTKKRNIKFAVAMSVGLILAMLGDIFLGFDFIVGASLFAGGHICYFVGQSFLKKPRIKDLATAGIIFLCAGSFILFCPLLTFDTPVMKWVCLAYAMIISLMVGKSISNVSTEQSVLTAVLAVGCVLFFFSDLMLVFDWFMNGGKITGILCMSTYYPAEVMLAWSVFLSANKK